MINIFSTVDTYFVGSIGNFDHAAVCLHITCYIAGNTLAGIEIGRFWRNTYKNSVIKVSFTYFVITNFNSLPKYPAV